MDGELPSFYPVFLLLSVILVVVAGLLVVPHLIAPRKKTPVKEMPYEAGMDPIGDARQHFDVKFYLVAILFLVFDVELLFLYPWAVSAYRQSGGIPAGLSGPVFAVMLVFLATLVIGYVYAWKKG